MSIARDFHTSTLLPNGKVLVTGGLNPISIPQASAELYDPTTGLFFPTGSMNIGRYAHTATLLPNGKVLIAGGVGVEVGQPGYASAELYDPVAGVFSPTGSMGEGRYIHTATLLANGKVLIVGGNRGPYYSPAGGAELYDPATGDFTSAGQLSVMYHSATLLPSGRVLIAGGGDPPISTARLYDPDTGVFSPTGSMNHNRQGHSATLLQDGKVLITGGSSMFFTNTSAELYDPFAGLFTLTGSTVYPHHSHTASLLPGGKVLIAGGGPGGYLGSPSTFAELYDPSGGLFSGTGSMSSARFLHTATLLLDGTVLVAGGRFSGAQASAEIFSPPPPPDRLGPVSSNVVVTPTPLAVNTNSTLTSVLDDSATGGSSIVSAQYSVDGGALSAMQLTATGAVAAQAEARLPTFSQPNVYSVCVRGTDSAGNVGADSCSLLPVYDPSGGFVTGGGQVASPPGADLLNTSAVGPANFGFVSKYHKGQNIPSGNLEFQFRAGNLTFKSSNMDWLVVTGQPRAIFRGTGTLNGSTVCSFEVDAWDGSFQPGNADAVGLRIFACTNGNDRYSLTATPLTHGSIIIH